MTTLRIWPEDEAEPHIGNTPAAGKPTSALDVQEGGSHYKDMPIQPVEFITKNLIPYLEGNVIKYVCRHRRKNGLEDLKKAQHYIALIMELEYGVKSETP